MPKCEDEDDARPCSRREEIAVLELRLVRRQQRLPAVVAHEVLWRDDGGQLLPPPDEAQLEDGDTFATRARPRIVLILTFRHPGLQAAPVCPSESA